MQAPTLSELRSNDYFSGLSMKKISRGRLYVDKDVQRALLLQMIRHWAMFGAVLTGILLALDSLTDPSKSFGEHFFSLWQTHASLLVTIAALFPIFVYESFKLSNRFSGPMLRLRRLMRQAADGEPVRPIEFRDGDFWQDMAESFNDLVSRLEAKQNQRPDSSSGGCDVKGAAPASADEASGELLAAGRR
jgi:hypothetical protein